jgi:predicted AAA+ superfamily ATPase
MEKYKRLISLPNNNSFFLFGQRGVGKSTLLREELLFSTDQKVLLIDLLDSRTYLELSSAPWKISERVAGYSTVIIDEIQKIPHLLDEVHKLIEERQIKFALTGSSARKLKRAGVNMLAGRAYRYNLYPLTFKELGDEFNLEQVLQWGSLPAIMHRDKPEDKEDYLYTYVGTYLKEEIILEQLVRRIQPFSHYLEVAAQTNGENVNYENISKDVGVGAISVKTYFEILVDTLVGFFLPAYHSSKRKRQRRSPKFYFFDLGLVRTLQNNLSIPPRAGTLEYGKLFETFLINEIIRLSQYKKTRFEFSHLRVDARIEIDLIIEPPGCDPILVEIRSKDRIDERDLAGLKTLGASFVNSKRYLLSRDETSRVIDDIRCLHWKRGVQEIFGEC